MRKLSGLVSLALPLLASAMVAAAPARCPVQAEVVQWAADFCMYAAETDDLAHPDVVKCLQRQADVPETNACSMKKKYKSKICAIVVRNHSYPGSVKKCVRDDSLSGPMVGGRGL